MQTDGLVLALDFLQQADLLSKEGKAKLIKCLRLLAFNPQHPGLRTKKLKGARHPLFECRVDRRIRLVYDWDNAQLRCWWVGDHDKTLAKGASANIEVDDIFIDQEALVTDSLERWEDKDLSGVEFVSSTISVIEVELLQRNGD